MDAASDPVLPAADDDDDRPGRSATEALLATMSLCPMEVQRRTLGKRVVTLTLPLADTAARRFGGRGVDLDDLTQVARLGLVKAVRGYRVDRGNGFAAYAMPTITGEVKRYFRDHSWAVRPPRQLQEVSARVAREEADLRHELQRDPTTREVATSMGVSRAVLDEARLAATAYRALSLEGTPAAPVPIDVPDKADDFDDVVTRDALRRALAGLTARQREIVRLRFVEERTQSEIATAIGVSQMQVSRLLSGIVRQLREDLTDESEVA